ncbi:MAG: HNH endonuclease [Lachnospiraceae bacterium]|nr:HNH endonuclease [Lachnospiraceae bacterium]
MPIYKRCSRCGGRLLTGQKCPCRVRESNREYDRFKRDKESKRFYDSAEWRRTKERVLELDGMDVYEYMTTGEVVAADTVHHIVPLRDDWSKRVDMRNLMSLNAATHSKIETEYKRNKQKMIENLTRILAEFRENVRVGGI